MAKLVKATDCKSVTVGSNPTGVSMSNAFKFRCKHCGKYHSTESENRFHEGICRFVDDIYGRGKQKVFGRKTKEGSK